MKVGDLVKIWSVSQQRYQNAIILRGPFEIVNPSLYSNEIIGYETCDPGTGTRQLLLRQKDVVLITAPEHGSVINKVIGEKNEIN
jgi:hypothetical protein